jgi:hypothetical protein
MITLRIRGLYAVALTQLFRQHADAWEIVQPDNDVRACISHPWRMDSPDMTIDDEADEHGRSDMLRFAGTTDLIQAALALIQQHCVDVIVHRDGFQVGAIYMGLVGICSRASRRAVVYLGNGMAGVLPLRYDDRDLAVGSYMPVRIAAVPAESDGRPELSAGLTLPGQYAVLTSVPAVRMSKQITEPQELERLQRLGERYVTNEWGIIWRTAAQHTDDQVLVSEVQRLTQQARTLQQQLRETTTVGYVQGGDIVARVYFGGQAKAYCDTLRAQLLPTLPGHHKYKAQGDVYGATVDALEKELPAHVLQARTSPLGVLASINAMQQPIQENLRLVVHDLQGGLHNQEIATRVEHDLQAGQLDVRRPLRHKDAYPADLRLKKQPGDYAVTRFREAAWSYTTHIYSGQGVWKAAYASLTTPLAIFADQVHLVDLGVSVMRSPQHAPEIRGLPALQRAEEQGIVTTALVRKIQEEAEILLRQFTQDVGADASC